MTKRWTVMLLAACTASAWVTGCAEDPLDLGQPRSCSIEDQNAWVHGVMQEIYLWTDEMPDVDPADHESPAELVRALRVDPDRWSRVSDLAASEALYVEGKSVGLGMRTKRSAHGELVVASVHAGSPAALADVRRGDYVRTIGGLTIMQLDEDDGWEAAYGANLPGVSVAMTIERRGAPEREVVLTKSWVEIQTVPVHGVVQAGDHRVGYLVLQTFVEPAIEALDAAFAEFADAGVTDVVVDLRYNGGGLIAVSRHLVDLLVGGRADGEVAYRVRYNDNLSELDQTRQVAHQDHSLPGVERVAFITSPSTLSASELTINAVRAHVPTWVVGGTTGGKPVGSKHIAFCDSLLAPVTFRLLNADFEGEYYDGIAVTCPAIDDLGRELGDPGENSLSTALALMAGEPCPALPEDPDGLDAPPRRDESQEAALDGRPLELMHWY